MKRTATAVLVTSRFEIAIHADQLHEIYPRQQLLQKFLGYIRHGSDSLRPYDKSIIVYDRAMKLGVKLSNSHLRNRAKTKTM